MSEATRCRLMYNHQQLTKLELRLLGALEIRLHGKPVTKLLARTPDGWRILEMIREFALAQMSRQEHKATQQRHIAYFVAQPTTDLDTIIRDHANLRTALASAITAHDTHAALTLCLKLSWLWEMHGLFHEGMTVARAALSMPVGEDARLRMDVSERVSTLAWQVHQFDIALHYSAQISATGR